MKKSLGLAIGLSLLLSACSNTNDDIKPTTPVNTNPTTTTPGTTNPGTTNPGTTNPGTTPSTNPDTTNPGNTTPGTTPSTTSLTYKEEIPAVPRNVNTGDYTCPTSGSIDTPLSQRLGRGPATLDQGTRVNLFKAQTALPETIQDLLYSSKSIINNMYYGYSTVDLEALHESNYNAFKKEFPKALNSYLLSDNYYSYSNLNDTQLAKVDSLMDSYIDGVKDGHTFYMNPAQTTADKQGSSPAPVLGVNYSVVPGEDGVVLTSVRLNGPAWNAGLRRGDVIVSVGGTPLTRTAGTSDDDLYTTYRKLIGDATATAKPFTMTVKTAGKARDVSVTGAILKGTNMPWGEVRTDSSGKSHYYLRIPTFSSVAPERSGDVSMPIASRVHQLVAEAQSKGVDNIVVDLRGNGGGLLIEFVGVAAAFAPDVAGESTRYVDGSSLNFGYSGGNVTISDPCGYSGKYAVQNVTKWNGKLTVLVDGNSASASEMFSTNMRQAGFKIIGTETYGVGSTSTYHFDLPAGRSMSVTAGRTLIGGKPVDEHVVPDIQSKDDLKQLADTGVDNTLETAYNTMK